MLHDKTAPAINIAECVRKVRTYRMHSVQTIPQFQFLYLSIQRHISFSEVVRLIGSTSSAQQCSADLI